VIGGSKRPRTVQASEEKHRTLFEGVTSGVICLAFDGCIVFANPTAERLPGLWFDQRGGNGSMTSRWRMVTLEGDPVYGSDDPEWAVHIVRRRTIEGSDGQRERWQLMVEEWWTDGSRGVRTCTTD